MILRLDPRLPLVWRSPTSVQLGIDPPVAVLHDVTEAQERLLAALSAGVSDTGAAMIAGDPIVRDELVAAVRPALEPPSAGFSLATVAVSGVGPVADAIAEALAGSGVRVLATADPAALVDARPDLAVLTADHVLAPSAHAMWLRRDVPHLPVVLGDSAATIGPLVEPGAAPCLLCLELHRRDADPAWPAIATQLLGRRSRAVSPTLVMEAAAAAARAVLHRMASGASAAVAVRIEAATGERTARHWQPHPDCGCRGLRLSPDRTGTDWVAADRRVPPEREQTTTARAAAGRA
jgi:bacteriocin biosynthesis cyclodehydratase domain-containing protein